jgi:hypothetical protein
MAAPVRRRYDPEPENPAYTLVGWQGITAQVPGAWNIGAIGGDRKAGYLRVDGPEMPRLEVKWSDASVDIERALDKYLKQLGKGRRGRITVERGIRVISRRARPDKRLSGFSWRGPQQAFGVIWRCQVCKRTVIAQVLGRNDEDLAPLAREILGSLEDHPRDDSDVWAVYDLVCRVPKSYALESQKLMAGLTELSFMRGRQRLRVRRLGMAEIVLGDASFLDWARIDVNKRKEVWCDGEAIEFKGHDAARLAGERRRLLGFLRTPAERLLRRKNAVSFSALVWHCLPSNHIYSVEALHDGDDAVVNQIADSVACHAAQAFG